MQVIEGDIPELLHKYVSGTRQKRIAIAIRACKSTDATARSAQYLENKNDEVLEHFLTITM